MEDSHRFSKYESPLRYPGGKACIFPFVSKLFYENNLVGLDYAEPYAGGSGLALKLLYNEYVNEIFINDLDVSIYTFWKVLLNSNLKFCDWVENVKITVDNWYYYKSLQSTAKNLNDLDIAKSLFFLNRTNISGVVKGGIIGGLSQMGKYKIDARFNKSDLLSRIQRIEKYKNRINLSNLDGISFIQKLNRKKERIFIYLDPPYLQKGADLYMNFYSLKDHEKLSKKVNLIRKDWMVSYDNHDFILKLYSNNKKLVYRLSQSASNRVGDEILIFSDQLNYSKSKAHLNNPIELT